MFEWQAECLANERVLNGKNLVSRYNFSLFCNVSFFDKLTSFVKNTSF
jgi:hypothetical protein